MSKEQSRAELERRFHDALLACEGLNDLLRAKHGRFTVEFLLRDGHWHTTRIVPEATWSSQRLSEVTGNR